MLTPGEVTQILSPTHWHNRAPTTTLNEFTTQKLTSQQRFTTSSSSNFLVPTNKNFQSHLFRLRDIANFPGSREAVTGYPPKRNTETFCAPAKPAKLVISSQHDSVYYQQEIKDDQFLNLSINSRQS
ncbi:hypothetical protein QL285_081975 [Trifolium repens]|nr:hypothetical protein QL285_081975 [Trifolium repens]